MSKDETLEYLEQIKTLCLEIIARLESADKPRTGLYQVTSVHHYISNSGNPTWKAFTTEGDIIYLRQANKDLLVKADLWSLLNEMSIGETWDAQISIEAIQDGDFLRPVKITGTPSLYAPPEQETLDDADEIPFDNDILDKLKSAGDEL